MALFHIVTEKVERGPLTSVYKCDRSRQSARLDEREKQVLRMLALQSNKKDVRDI